MPLSAFYLGDEQPLFANSLSPGGTAAHVATLRDGHLVATDGHSILVTSTDAVASTAFSDLGTSYQGLEHYNSISALDNGGFAAAGPFRTAWVFGGFGTGLAREEFRPSGTSTGGGAFPLQNPTRGDYTSIYPCSNVADGTSVDLPNWGHVSTAQVATWTDAFTRTDSTIVRANDGTVLENLSYYTSVGAAELTSGHLALTFADQSGNGVIDVFASTSNHARFALTGVGHAVNSPVIASLPNGNFAVAWADGTDGYIHHAVFNEAGARVSAEMTTNQVTTGSPSSPVITATTDGHFAIAWQDTSAGTGSDIKERLFNADGSPATDEFLVNHTTAGDQVSPSITALHDGGLYTAWSDANGVHGQAIEFYDPQAGYKGAETFFWNDRTGHVAVTAQNGMQTLQTQYVSGIPSEWSIAGAGDFNGDGSRDILWRDTSGHTAIWTMQGDQVAGQTYIPSAPTDWHVAGTGDFNGDGKDDILWRDSAGHDAIWFMNGTSVIGKSYIDSAPTNWSVAGVGDFNGDGHADILWRDTAGDNAIWTMNGAQATAQNAIAGASTDWSVAGVGDFNGDHRADILWRDTAGNDVIWNMNGSTVAAQQYTAPATTDWHVAGISDFNHDNHADILWQNTSGDVAIWEMNNAQVLPNQAAVITHAAPGWDIIA